MKDSNLRKKLIKAKLVILLLFLCCLLFAVDLPEREGYHWEEFKESKCFFLIPNEWKLRKEKKEETFSYFFTKENIEENGSYSVGISVNIVTGLKKTNTLRFIAYLKEGLEETTEEFECSDLTKVGPFYKYILNYEKECDGILIKMHHILISNINTNTMYLILFESPKSEYDKNFKIAEPTLMYFGIDDEI